MFDVLSELILYRPFDGQKSEEGGRERMEGLKSSFCTCIK